MFVCLGYNVSESSLNKYFKDKNKNKVVRILGVRVLELDAFETLDLSLDDIVKNKIEISGSILDYDDIEKSVYVYMGENGKIEYFQGGEYNRVTYEPFNSSMPAFCNGELVSGFPERQSFKSNRIVYYKIGNFTLYIDVITSGISVKAYGFELLNANYKSDGLAPIFGEGLGKVYELKDFDCRDTSGIEYINDTLASILNPVDDIYLIENGIKYVYIGGISRDLKVVIPPTVDDIHLADGHFKDKSYLVEIVVNKEKYSLLVDKLYDNIGIYAELGKDSLADKLKIINSLNIEVSTYG